ncbi:uncharacterized protein [Diadema antillarum]|uniref:uncharacterized protein n=1 Tax=Diadema antillarum TaxID=105358 RepID=UPI003A868D4B
MRTVSKAVVRFLGLGLCLALLAEGSSRVARGGCSMCLRDSKYSNLHYNFCRACGSPMQKKSQEDKSFTEVIEPMDEEEESLMTMIENTSDLLGNVLRLLKFEKDELERLAMRPYEDDGEDEVTEQRASERLMSLRNILRK